MKTFQKPLTPEEESRYLQEYKKGSPEAKDILIERNLRLVAHIVKKYQGAPEELDDLISIGTIGPPPCSSSSFAARSRSLECR